MGSRGTLTKSKSQRRITKRAGRQVHMQRETDMKGSTPSLIAINQKRCPRPKARMELKKIGDVNTNALAQIRGWGALD